MKKTLGILVAVIISLAGALTYTQTEALAASSESSSLNNFTISSFTIDYHLSRKDDGHSQLIVKETIVASFPFYSTNHGLERSIPTRYQYRNLPLELTSVTDGRGIAWNYETRQDGDNTIVRIGDKDAYVKGEQTYILSYTLSDVTRYFSDNNRDEWYWDTNGTGWKVPIKKLTVNATIDSALTGALYQDPRCYVGKEGSTATCVLEKISDSLYTVTQENLSKGENITVAFGFPKNTFAVAQLSVLDIYLMIVEAVSRASIIIGVVLLILYVIQFDRRTKRKNETGFIPVQYIPPKDISPLVAAELVSSSYKKLPAQLIDLAVRHYITLSELSPKSLFHTADYEVKIIKDTSTLLAEEREILSDMFGGTLPAVGATLSLKSLRKDRKYAKRLYDNTTKLNSAVRTTYGLRSRDWSRASFIYAWAIPTTVAGIILLSIPLIITGIIMFIGLGGFYPLTDKGLEIRRYLLGYLAFIKAAEVERLAMLQGPDTAEKVGYAIDVNDKGQRIKLYERSLPYAILFGLETQWANVLSDLYQQQSETPSWYIGTSAFNAAAFSSTISSFSSSAASYGGTGSSTSSGSGGGGFSGGGGGGGGGGGW